YFKAQEATKSKLPLSGTVLISVGDRDKGDLIEVAKMFDQVSLIAVEHLRHLDQVRSEEHTSELQSRFELVCRLLLEKKNDLKTPPVVVRRDQRIAGITNLQGWIRQRVRDPTLGQERPARAHSDLVGRAIRPQDDESL